MAKKEIIEDQLHLLAGKFMEEYQCLLYCIATLDMMERCNNDIETNHVDRGVAKGRLVEYRRPDTLVYMNQWYHDLKLMPDSMKYKLDETFDDINFGVHYILRSNYSDSETKDYYIKMTKKIKLMCDEIMESELQAICLLG